MPEQSHADDTPTTTEEVAAETDESPQTAPGDDAPPPVLNRAERRAQAKGGKSGSAFNPSAPGASGARGGFNSRGAGAGQTRLPRRSGGK